MLAAARPPALTEPWTLEEPPRALSTHLPNPAVPVLPGAPARAASLPALLVERMRARAAVGQQVGPAASVRA